MPLLSALTAGDYDKLRAPRYHGATYMTVLPTVTVFSGQQDGDLTTASITALTLKNTSGTYSDIRAGMRVQVATDSAYTDIVHDGRVRKTATSPTIELDEISVNIFNNFYVRVLDDFPVLPRKPKITDGTFFADFDLAYEQLPPLVTGVQSAYAGFTSGGVLTISFAPSVTVVADGETLSSTTWAVGDGTITTGTASSKDITATFPEGVRWVHFTATDSGGNALTRHILIVAADNTDASALFLHYDSLTVRNRVGEGARMDVVTYADTTDWLRRQLVVVWSDEAYDGTAGPIDDNIIFYGRRAALNDRAVYETDGGVTQETRHTFNGTLAQIGSQIAFPFTLETVSSAADWFDVETLTVWRAVWFLLVRMSTVAEIVTVQFDATDDVYRLGDTDTQGASVYDQLRDLVASIGAQFQEGRDGRVEIARRLVLIESALDRADVPTVANWTTADVLGDLSVETSEVEQVALVRMFGGSYNTDDGTFSAYEAIAPGVGFGVGTETLTINRQVLKADAGNSAIVELRARAGHTYANREPFRVVRAEHPDGYWFLLPDVQAKYTFANTDLLGAGDLVDTVDYWLEGVEVTHNAVQGTRVVRGVYQQVTEGARGQFVFPEVVETTEYSVPDVITFPDPPPGSPVSDEPLDDYTLSDGTYNAPDDTIDGDCGGDAAPIVVASRTFDEKCVEGVGISVGSTDMPATSIVLTLENDGSTTSTTTFTIKGTEALQAFDEVFDESVKADKLTISLDPTTTCLMGSRMRIFAVRVREDTHSDECQDVHPAVIELDEETMGRVAPNNLVEFAPLDAAVIGMYLRVVNNGTSCGFGRAATARLNVGGTQLLVNNGDIGTTTYGFRGNQAALDVLIAADVPGIAGSTAGSAFTEPAGEDINYATGATSPNAGCYPIDVKGWLVIDTNS